MLSKLLFASTSYFALSSAISAPLCKCAPHESCWPSDEDWGHFNTTIEGSLIRSHSMAAVCYKSQPDYNSTECSYILSRWTDSLLHVEDPTSIAYPALANNPCPPIFPNGTSVTGDPDAGKRGCSLGRFPDFVVNATSLQIITAALKWADQKRVRVVVKNTGHNHLGRSTGYGSISIWTHSIKGITYHKSFQSTTCPTNSGSSQMAVTVGAGEVGLDINQALAKHGVVMVAGSNPSVGVVGWLTGGGHGPLSASYGMGSDNLLEATIVTPNGTLMTVNSCQNQDLFYAVRGGGGGTFGVITSATMKVYTSPQTTLWSLTVTQRDNCSDYTWWKLIAYFEAEQIRFKNAGMQGYYLLLGPRGKGTRTLISGFYLYDKPNGTVATLFEHFKHRLDQNSDVVSYNSSVSTGASFMDVYEPNIQPEPVAQGGFSLGSRLLPASSLENIESVTQMLQEVDSAHENGTLPAPDLILGHMIANSENENLDTGLNPAWRKAVVHFLVVGGWPDGAPEHVAQAVRDDITFNKTYALRKLAPDSGAYFNEMDINEPNWQHAAFGENYPRLLAIKNKYDPDGLLWCRHCVGSEAWIEQTDGRLCRPEWYYK